MVLMEEETPSRAERWSAPRADFVDLARALLPKSSMPPWWAFWRERYALVSAEPIGRGEQLVWRGAYRTARAARRRRSQLPPPWRAVILRFDGELMGGVERRFF